MWPAEGRAHALRQHRAASARDARALPMEYGALAEELYDLTKQSMALGDALERAVPKQSRSSAASEHRARAAELGEAARALLVALQLTQSRVQAEPAARLARPPAAPEGPAPLQEDSGSSDGD
jgi:hypothetical protein